MDFVRRWSEKTEIGAGRFIRWLDIAASKFYDWRERYGKVNEHNGWVPRDFWLEDWEKQAIIALPSEEPAGRLSAADVHDAGRRHRGGESDQRLAGAGAGGTVVEVERKAVEEGHGLRAAAAPHQHWHIDVSYINISGDVLLPVQRSGRLQPIHRPLGSARVDDRGGHRDHPGAGQGAVSRTRGPGSSPTTGRSSSPRTSRSSFGSRA